jgi:hypothetical protein
MQVAIATGGLLLIHAPQDEIPVTLQLTRPRDLDDQAPAPCDVRRGQVPISDHSDGRGHILSESLMATPKDRVY